jgi:hypothetical protein
MLVIFECPVNCFVSCNLKGEGNTFSRVLADIAGGKKRDDDDSEVRLSVGRIDETCSVGVEIVRE